MSTNNGSISVPPGWTPVVFALGLGGAFIATMSFTLPDAAAAVLLDRGGMFPYPFTIQNLMHLLFFFGLGELFVRWRVGKIESAFKARSYLPEDEETILQAQDLGVIRSRVREIHDGENGFLPFLIDICILQFHTSRSVDQAVSVLNSSLDLMSHRLDLRYTTLRYLAWVIPTIGFVGTVVGIGATLAAVDPSNPDLQVLTARLAVAFNTTLVALVMSAILVFLMHGVQRKDESALNDAGMYTLRNLINRLYEGQA